jgi:hypothetical protein
MTVQPMIRFVAGTTTLFGGLFFAFGSVGFATIRAVKAVPLAVPAICLLLAAMFFAATAYLWVRAANMAEGDDLFSGDRGLLVSLMIVTVLVLTGGTIWMVAHRDFWLGMFDGLSSGLG